MAAVWIRNWQLFVLGICYCNYLFNLPEEHTGCEEEKEAGEEDREEDKEVDVELVLPEEDAAERHFGGFLVRRLGPLHDHVELGGAEVVAGVGQRHDQPVAQVAHVENLKDEIELNFSNMFSFLCQVERNGRDWCS